MPTLLKGNIIFINDVFKHINTREEVFEHSVGKIEDALIAENMIQFYIPNPGDFISNYNVFLQREDSGMKYKGIFKNPGNENYTGTVECELFENQKKFLLQGEWYDNDEIYTWWAVFNK